MKLQISRRPQAPTIIEGFPGLGLVGTIATEFIIEHLGAKLIGTITSDKVAPMAAIHDGELVQPMGMYYAAKKNILILHVITNTPGLEWPTADLLLAEAKKMKAKEIISLESVATPQLVTAEPQCFYYSNKKATETKMQKLGIEKLQEGIVMGVSGAVMLQSKLPFVCLFAETHSKMPDSRAAAQIIHALNKYLKLNIDTSPLLESAERFEAKLKAVMARSQEAAKHADKNSLSYVG